MLNETINPFLAMAVDGFVLLEGKPGIAITLSPDCALESAARIEAAAFAALVQRAASPSCTNGFD